MPEISRFFGVSIRIYFNDHLPPHFHALYGAHEALIEIVKMKFLRGHLPGRLSALVLKWGELHRDELMDNWNLARERKPLNPIEPLE